MPVRIQRKRTKGWRMPPNTRCVTRPGKFGNPFATAAEFREWLEACTGSRGEVYGSMENLNRMLRIAKDLEELRGLNLACYCPPTKECHADVLIEYANRESK